MKFSEGNGHDRGRVDRIPLGAGHVVYTPGNPPPQETEVPLALEQVLLNDLKEHPEVRILAILPLIQNGNTIRIHLWYETLPGTVAPPTQN